MKTNELKDLLSRLSITKMY